MRAGKITRLKAITIAVAFLDLAPVLFLCLGLFFLAQLADRLDPRSRGLARSGLVLIALGLLSRFIANLSAVALSTEIPVLATTPYVFCGPGFTLMAAALLRARSSSLDRPIDRDPWLAPTATSWVFLIAAFYASQTGREWPRILLVLALLGSASVCATGGRLGWKRHLHMAAALFGFSFAATLLAISSEVFLPEIVWIRLLGTLVNSFGQAAFAFASWRVAAEYQARIGPISTA